MRLWMALAVALLSGIVLGFVLARRRTLAPIIFRHKNPDGSLDTTTTMKVVAIVLSIVTVGGFLAAAGFAGVVKYFTDKTIEPTNLWLDGFNSILIFEASMLGISVGGTIGKRATAKADVIEATARAATGVAASPGSPAPPVAKKKDDHTGEDAP